MWFGACADITEAFNTEMYILLADNSIYLDPKAM